MFKLKVLGSSSKGNCYLVGDENEVLILECGIKIEEIKKALDYNITCLVGALISHQHKDHAKYKKDIQNICDVYDEFENLKQFKLGNFTILPFKNYHDVDCYGFLIHHTKMGKLVFSTDSYMIKPKFNNINHWLLECNYIKSMVTDDYLKQRLIYSHMDLNTLVLTLKRQDLKTYNNLVLLHLSNERSDKDVIINTIINNIGIKPFIAEKNLEINLNLDVF